MTDQQQYPTREQIAEPTANELFDLALNGGGTRGDALVRIYRRGVEDALALFPQPEPSAEPTCTCGHIMDDHDLSDTGECQVAIPWCSCVAAKDAAAPPSIADMAPGTTNEERIRRDERMRWAIYLWGMDEDTDEPEGAFEEGADMAYHAVAAWLLANIARGFEVSDMPWLDPDLIADAKQKARLLPAHPDSEAHEVDRCIATLATIRDVVVPPATPEVTE